MHDADTSATNTKDVAAGISTTHATNPENETRELFVFEAVGRLFAVPVEEVAGTAENAAPASLPFAPAAILGVVCLRGRMLTVVDPTALANGRRFESREVLPVVIVLRGDQQLALAADRRSENLRVKASEIQAYALSKEASTPRGGPPAESAILGSVQQQDREVLILDSRKLFAAAMGKSDRRRRRT